AIRAVLPGERELGERRKENPADDCTVLKALTQEGAAMPSAPIAKPASAGPTARLRLKPTPLRATAARSSSLGTSCGTMACQAGIARTVATPDRKIKVSSQFGVTQLSHTNIANRAAITTAVICTRIRRRRRSTMSANAPAGRLNRNIGRVVAA